LLRYAANYGVNDGIKMLPVLSIYQGGIECTPSKNLCSLQTLSDALAGC